MSQTKEHLRQEARRHRALINPASEDFKAATDHFFHAIKPDTDQVVAGYYPKGREFDPYPIFEKLFERGITCALPVVQKDSRELKFAQWGTNTEMTLGAFGVYHPVVNADTTWLTPDIVVVPLLAFDRRGYRLGHGGGYYDATLKALRDKKDILAVGVAYAQQACLFNLPVEDHDQKLDWVITPQGTHYFG